METALQVELIHFAVDGRAHHALTHLHVCQFQGRLRILEAGLRGSAIGGRDQRGFLVFQSLDLNLQLIHFLFAGGDTEAVAICLA